MNSSYKLLALVGVLILAAGAYIFFQPKQQNIYGRALVLAFVDTEIKEDDHKLWEKQDLTLQENASCNSDNGNKLSLCIKQGINKAISHTQSQDKRLIILAESGYAEAIVNSLHEFDNKNINGIVLLKPTIKGNSFSGYQTSKMLIVSDINDSAEKLTLTRQLAATIRNQNNWVWSSFLVDSGSGLFKHPVLPHMTAYLINGPVNPRYKTEFDAESSWQHPHVDNKAFWQQDSFIQQHPISSDIQRIIKAFYAYDLNFVKQWPLETYHAFDLLRYRDSLPEEKQGRYATFSNRKGHKFFLDLEKYGQFVPEFVIGIDDEDNLYRLTSFYTTRQFYSWEQSGPSPDMLYSQSLGAFIHFQKPLPFEDELPYLQYSSILFESIAFTDEDPYRNITGLSDEAFKVVTLNCVPCHSVHGVGGAAHHLDAKTVQPQPGFAKPLLTYSRSVLENFFFNQTETAKLIGVNPNYVDADVGKELIAWLQPEED